MSAPTLIALISQKGGSGKTTVAMQLAAGLALEGYRVALADLDPQESASRWCRWCRDRPTCGRRAASSA